MTTKVNGFNLEVSEVDGLPRVRVTLADGTVVVDTDQVSIVGLGRMADVFAAAERMAFKLAEARGNRFTAPGCGDACL